MNQKKGKDLGARIFFSKETLFCVWNLSHLIKDLTYYEKKMAREAAFKSTRVVHANVRQATPAWTNSNRVNKANQFTPRPVQLNNIRPNLSTASKTIKNWVGCNRLISALQFKSGAFRFNTGKQHVVSVRVNRPIFKHHKTLKPSPGFGESKQSKEKFSTQRHPDKNNTTPQYQLGPTPDSNVNVSRGPQGRPKPLMGLGSQRETNPLFIVQDHPLKHMEHRGDALRSTLKMEAGLKLCKKNCCSSKLQQAGSSGHKQEAGGLTMMRFFCPEQEFEAIRLFISFSSFNWDSYLSNGMLKVLFQYGTIDEESSVLTTSWFCSDPDQSYKVYVDDIIFGSTNKSWCDEFEALMQSRFQMSSMGELTFFLGLQVKQNKEGIFISQDKYVAEILKKFDLVNVKAAITPMETKLPLTKDEEAFDVDVHLYRSMIGSLMYLTASRPDIMYAVSCLFTFQVTQDLSSPMLSRNDLQVPQCKPKLGLWYALTANPTIYDSLVKQFWQSAIASTKEDGFFEISATIDNIRYTITEASIRESLQLDDATGITMLPNDDLFQGMGQIGYPTDGTFTFWKIKKVKKLEGFLKRRNLVLTDSEDEEPEVQGRKSQADPQDSSKQGLSIDKGRRYKRRKESTGKKVVSSLDFQEDNTGAEKINTAGEVNAASIEVNTASKVNTGSIELNTVIEQDSTAGENKGQREGKAPMLSEETPKKTKEQILQEEASLCEPIRIGIPYKEKMS
ncbi:putative ribonuclease H-like domain-containing protein [Tanacetum coccineum]